jgi:hypothetical protein
LAWEPRVARTSLSPGFRPANCLLAIVKRRFAQKFRAQLERLSIAHADVFFGTSHAGSTDLHVVRCFLRHPRPYDSAEMGLHPALAVTPSESANAPPEWHDPLAARRPQELELLTSIDLAEYLEQTGIRLGRLGGNARRESPAFLDHKTELPAFHDHEIANRLAKKRLHSRGEPLD